MTAPTDAERAREIAGICENSAVVENCYDSQRQCAACVSTRQIERLVAAVRAEERERAAELVADLRLRLALSGLGASAAEALKTEDAIRRQEG